MTVWSAAGSQWREREDDTPPAGIAVVVKYSSVRDPKEKHVCMYGERSGMAEREAKLYLQQKDGKMVNTIYKCTFTVSSSTSFSSLILSSSSSSFSVASLATEGVRAGRRSPVKVSL